MSTERNFIVQHRHKEQHRNAKSKSESNLQENFNEIILENFRTPKKEKQLQ